MAERLTYVWRLVVTFPEGSDAAGWRPENYKDENYYYRADDDDRPFRWPPRRLYLSSESAYKRAYLLRRWGATVTVERSARVEGWEQMYG